MRSLLCATHGRYCGLAFAVAPGNCVEAGNAAQGEACLFVKCALCHGEGQKLTALDPACLES